MQSMRSLIQASRARAGVLVVTASAWAANVSAQLPTQADPDSGAIRDGNIIDAVKFYAKDIFLLAGLVIATVIFILVTTNAIAVYKEIRDGRRTWGDLGMHAGAGAVLIVFVVFLLTQAQDIIN